jgi:disulfide oxidoreductase YuzD
LGLLTAAVLNIGQSCEHCVQFVQKCTATFLLFIGCYLPLKLSAKLLYISTIKKRKIQLSSGTVRNYEDMNFKKDVVRICLSIKNTEFNNAHRVEVIQNINTFDYLLPVITYEV